MNIINFGSLNIDKVYDVPHIVLPKETIMANAYDLHPGGKGLNQSIALAKAGANVIHAGAIGMDGQLLIESLKKEGVDTGKICILKSQSGHTIIQVNSEGQNSIIVYGGANQELTKDYIDSIFKDTNPDDMVLMQNEVNNLDYIMTRAHEFGLKIAFNPSPLTDQIDKCNLDFVDYFILNEVESTNLARVSNNTTDYDFILNILSKKYSKASIIMTLGENGSLYKKGDTKYTQEIYKNKVIDTTAAGDTFLGFFISCMTYNFDVPNSLKYASAASAIAVSRKGAARSIPSMIEVEKFLRQQH